MTRTPHTPFRSLDAAEAEFVQAGRNEQVLNDHCGWGSKNKRDPATWDAASTRYGVVCETFSDAFRACCAGRSIGGTRSKIVDGKERVTRVSRIERNWATFDLDTMRQCVPGLDLPLWIYEWQAAESERQIAADLDGYLDEEQAAYYQATPEAEIVDAEIDPVLADEEWLCTELAEESLELMVDLEWDATEHEVDESMILDEAILLRWDDTASVEAVFGIEIDREFARPKLAPWQWR